MMKGDKQINLKLLKDIEKYCARQNNKIDMDHKITRTMLSTIANIVYRQIQCKSQSMMQTCKMRTDTSLTHYNQQIDEIKADVQNKIKQVHNQIQDLKQNISEEIMKIDNKVINHIQNSNKQIFQLMKHQTYVINQYINKNNIQITQLKDIIQINQSKFLQSNNNFDDFSINTNHKIIENEQITKLIKQQLKQCEKQIQKLKQKVKSMQKQVNKVDCAQRWINSLCNDFSNLSFVNDIVTNNSYSSIYVIGQPHIKQYYKFSMQIISMQKRIRIGIIDQFSNYKSQNYDNEIRIYYGSDGKCCNMRKYNYDQGIGFKVGQIIIMSVDINKGIVEWQVQSELRCKLQSNCFKSKSIKWVPYIYMNDKNDRCRIIQ